ncbi:hypothetical protein JVI29_002919 [Clostridium perfringens]
MKDEVLKKTTEYEIVKYDQVYRIHFYNLSDFRVSKNQKLSKKVMGCY